MASLQTVVEYKLPNNSSAAMLTRAVNQAIREGWEVLGEPMKAGPYIVQAVIKLKAKQ